MLRDRLAREDRAPVARADGGCPLLDEAGLRCTVYEDRPLGCRTFFCGKATHGKPENVSALNALSIRLEALNRAIDDDCQAVPLLQLLSKR